MPGQDLKEFPADDPIHRGLIIFGWKLPGSFRRVHDSRNPSTNKQ